MGTKKKKIYIYIYIFLATQKWGLGKLHQLSGKALKFRPTGQPLRMSTNERLLIVKLEFRWVRWNIQVLPTEPSPIPCWHQNNIFFLLRFGKEEPCGRITPNIGPILRKALEDLGPLFSLYGLNLDCCRYKKKGLHA